MTDAGVLRGVVLVLVAAFFGVQAWHYPLGTVSRAGPGLFPLGVSAALALVGGLTVVRALLARGEPLAFQARNIGLILLSLVLFAVLSQAVNMAAGIVALVLCASVAARPWSGARAAAVSAALLLVAEAFQRLFGLDLGLP